MCDCQGNTKSDIGTVHVLPHEIECQGAIYSSKILSFPGVGGGGYV